MNSGFAGTGKFACCSSGYTCISLNVPPAKSRGIALTIGTTTVKYANFLFQSPDWGLNSASRNREIRVLLPWIHLHFTQCSPCEKQGEFAFIAGTSAINAQISPCNLRSGASPLAPGHPQQRKYCLKGNTALRAVNFRVPPNGTLVTRDRI